MSTSNLFIPRRIAEKTKRKERKRLKTVVAQWFQRFLSLIKNNVCKEHDYVV